MNEPVPIVCASNSRYILPLSVMLASLVVNFDRKRELHIHIISTDATARDRENVRKSVEMNRPGLEGIEIHWHSLDPATLEKLPVPPGSHFSRDVYIRLFIPYILPESCERVLYLDCDMIVLSDVSALYDSAAQSNHALHAVHHLSIDKVSSERGVFDYAERDIPPDTRYFSSGVMVMNLKLWRERNLTPPMLEYLEIHADRVHVDQGALNAFLSDEWMPLDPRWNVASDILFEELCLSAGYTRDEWLRIKDDPFIVHYSGSKKPWQAGRRSPRYSYFYRYLQKTVFKDSIQHRPYVESIIGVRAYYQLWRWARAIVRGPQPGERE